MELWGSGGPDRCLNYLHSLSQISVSVQALSPKSWTHTYGNGYTTDHQVFRVVINGTLTVDVDCAAMVMTRVDGVS